jgi:hypothetical protein
MTKGTAQGIARFIMTAAAGALLHGWRGAIAYTLIAGVACAVAQDHINAMESIAKKFGK